MQEKEGKLIQKFPFYLLHTSKEVHHHGFIVPNTKSDIFRVQGVKNKDKLNIYLTNLKIPHNIPTGDHGNPKYYVDVEFIKDGKVIKTDSQTITKKDGFVYRETKELTFPIETVYDKVRVKLSRKLSWEDKEKKIAEFEF